MTSAAIILWVFFAIVDIILTVLPPQYLSMVIFFTAASIALFVAAVVYTVKEEKVRHDSGESGLGKAGITAITVTISLLVITFILMYVMHYRVFRELYHYAARLE